MKMGVSTAALAAAFMAASVSTNAQPGNVAAPPDAAATPLEQQTLVGGFQTGRLQALVAASRAGRIITRPAFLLRGMEVAVSIVKDHRHAQHGDAYLDCSYRHSNGGQRRNVDGPHYSRRSEINVGSNVPTGGYLLHVGPD
jgi:hypothetical protein